MFESGKLVSESHRPTAYAVECIDLSKWIQETFDKEDHIVLKMDIEGAEYEVIKKMYKDGTLGMINKFSGELHGTKVCKTRAETDKLLEYCSDYGLKIYIWDAISSKKVSNKYYNRKILDAEFDKWEKRFDKSTWGSLDRWLARKVFIDCGAHMGSSIKFFLENFPDAQDYEIYSFEANPNFYKGYEEDHLACTVPKLNFNQFTFIPKAVWTEDTKVTFFKRDARNSESSTLIKKKTEIQYNKGWKKIEVDAIDFTAWLKNNFTPEDHIVLKMDIEGAEYEVLEKMYQQDAFKYISEFYCELHNVKCGRGRDDDRKIIERFNEHDLTIYLWDANLEHNVGFKEVVYDLEWVGDENELYPRDPGSREWYEKEDL